MLETIITLNIYAYTCHLLRSSIIMANIVSSIIMANIANIFKFSKIY